MVRSHYLSQCSFSFSQKKFFHRSQVLRQLYSLEFSGFMKKKLAAANQLLIVGINKVDCKYFSKRNLKIFLCSLPKLYITIIKSKRERKKGEIPETNLWQLCRLVRLRPSDSQMVSAKTGSKGLEWGWGWGARKSAIILTYPPGLGEPPSPGQSGKEPLLSLWELFCFG